MAEPKGARVRVYGFAEKTRMLINSALIPTVTTVDAFCVETGIARANYFRICNNERPGPPGKVSRVEITHKVLAAITKTYNIPDMYFTSEYTLSEFEQLLNKGPWESLVNLTSSTTQSDFCTTRPVLSTTGGTTRIGPVEENDGPELGIFRIYDLIAFEFTSQPGWHVILLDHRPDGNVVCLLPFVSETSEIAENGQLRLPGESYWQVQANDPPGTHLLAAIFYDKSRMQLSIDEKSIAQSLSPNSALDNQRNALSALYDSLSDSTKKRPKPYEVLVKDLYIAAG